jgi:hypothetical protein
MVLGVGEVILKGWWYGTLGVSFLKKGVVAVRSTGFY